MRVVRVAPHPPVVQEIRLSGKDILEKSSREMLGKTLQCRWDEAAFVREQEEGRVDLQPAANTGGCAVWRCK